MSKLPKRAGAELCLLMVRVKVLPSQTGYWDDILIDNDDFDYKLQRIMDNQTPEIITELKAWAEKWTGKTHGGSRPGAGRKPGLEQRKTTSFKVTEEEKEKIRELLKELRK